MRWSYYVVELSGEDWDLQSLLDECGQAGWELVSMGRMPTGTNRFREAAVFKRPVES